jgi:hypothetical protein
MGEGALPPEVWLDLKIRLDRLATLEARCQDALSRLAEGELSPEAYLDLVREQIRAQGDWEERHKRVFGMAPARPSGLGRLKKPTGPPVIDPLS